MKTYAMLIEEGERKLAEIAGADYAYDVFSTAALNATGDPTLDDEAFCEQIYNSLSGVLESRNAPDAYYDAAIQ
jgi:hypothetical protein